ncbi:MAG: uroporphyrinogen decarboxylase family protein [Bacilli bacterium]|nr:uroporphyrinogen decarboxylase family protein [Bacilli bacterium]
MFRKESRKPDFNNVRLMLEKKPAPRTVLFDFIIGSDKEKFLVGDEYKVDTEFDRVVTTIKAFDSGGYDFAPLIVRGMEFPRREHGEVTQTKSLNEGTMITDRKSFEEYPWPNLKNADFSIITKAGNYLSEKAKFIVFSHDGILENTIGIVGFDNLCYLIFDDLDLVGEIFTKVGERIYQYFIECLEYDEVGAILCNDDWGFNSQTMISPDLLRKFVFPWYKKIVQKAHEKGKYAILHSCGYYYDIIEDVIEDMKFDGRQSYEDKIVRVEKAYQELHPRIAVLGGIDIDFLARSSSEEVYQRFKKMIEMTKATGGYALGSGNSIPEYIPLENFKALLRAALEN